MLHVLGLAAIVVAGGAFGYWLRGQSLKETTSKEASKQDQPSQMISDSTRETPSEKE